MVIWRSHNCFTLDMKKQLTRLLDLISNLIPLHLYPILMKRDGIDFFYHAVSDEPMDHARHLYPVVPVVQFEDALDYLRERYPFVSYNLIHAHRIAGESLPKNSVHISFDDGFAECFSVVRPVLLKRSITCTFFISTDWIDNQAMFYRNKISLCVDRLRGNPSLISEIDTWAPDAPTLDAVVQWLKEFRLSDIEKIDAVCDALGVDWETFLQESQPYLTIPQIQQMHAEGFTIGAHTKTHRKLKDLPDAEIEEEIVESCRRIREITGQEIVPFSFPHSAFGIDRALLADIRARHPIIGLLFDTKGVRKDENFIVNRVWAERPLTPERKLHSLPEVLHNAYQEAWVDELMGWGRKLRDV